MSSEALGCLAQNIITPEEWKDVRRTLAMAGLNSSESIGTRYYDSEQGVETLTNVKEWYWQREQTRALLGVYKQTAVLSWLNKAAPGYFIHNGRDEDLTMVSYVPGVEDAKRDKRHKIKLGRLIVRLCPLLTDEHVRNLVTAHCNEADPNVEILYGADNIRKVYTEGPGACMSKDLTAYETKDASGKRHAPTEVYDMPNIGVAVTRDSKGIINGRALVLPNKKVYIRANYGSPLLKAKLEANGYGPGTLCGEELKLIVLDKAENGQIKFVLPYIDGNGGAGKVEHSTVALIEGKLMVLTPGQVKRAMSRNLVGKYTCATNTSGYGRLTPSTMMDFDMVDTITGKRIPDDAETVRVFYKGEIHETTAETWAAVVAESGAVPALTYHYANTGHSSRVYAFKTETFYYNGAYYTRNKDTVNNLGLIQLDPAYYGEWRIVPHSRDIVVNPGSEYGLRIKDCRTIITVNQAATSELKPNLYNSSMPFDARVMQVQVYDTVVEHNSVPTKDRKLVQVHTVRGSKVFATEGVTVVKTNTGRKVVPGFHSVYRTWDGEYILSTSKHGRVAIGDREYLYLGNTLPAELEPGGSAHRAAWMRSMVDLASELTSPASFDNLAARFDISIDGERVSGWHRSIRSMAESRATNRGIDYNTALRDITRQVVLAVGAAEQYQYNSVPEAYRKDFVALFEQAFYSVFYGPYDARAVDYTVVQMHDSLPSAAVVTEQTPIEVEVVHA